MGPQLFGQIILVFGQRRANQDNFLRIRLQQPAVKIIDLAPIDRQQGGAEVKLLSRVFFRLGFRQRRFQQRIDRSLGLGRYEAAFARQRRAKSWELRAAVSLARLWRAQGKVREETAR